MKEWYVSFKKTRWFPLVAGIVWIIFGILCIANPKAQMEGVAMYFGLAVLACGIFEILAGVMNKENQKVRITNIVIGAVLAVAAIFIFANLPLIGKYLPTLIGFVMIVSAISQMIRSLVLMSNGMKTWWIGAVPAVVVLVLGFVFLLNPGYVGKTIGIFTGISLLVNGVSSLIGFAQYKETNAVYGKK